MIIEGLKQNNKKNRKMKTKIKFTVVFIITIMLSSFIFASALSLTIAKKSHLAKTPCSKNIVAINYEKAISEDFYIEDEEYIVDIPFNTANISADSKYFKAVSVEFELEEESYIDDIPFNTKKRSS